MKTFKEWFRLREGLWNSDGKGPERFPQPVPYNRQYKGGGGAPLAGGMSPGIPPAGGMGKMSKRMKKKMKPS